MFTLDTSFREPVATQGGGEHDTKANHNPKLLKLFPNRNGTLPDLAIGWEKSVGGWARHRVYLTTSWPFIAGISHSAVDQCGPSLN